MSIMLNESLVKALKLPPLKSLHNLMPLTGLEKKAEGKRSYLFITNIKPATLRIIRNEIAGKRYKEPKIKSSNNFQKQLDALCARVSALENINHVK